VWRPPHPRVLEEEIDRMVTTMSRQVGAQEMTFEAGKLAKLADGSVVVTY
jgi:polyribonucleotide nucleotidyltransferase